MRLLLLLACLSLQQASAALRGIPERAPLVETVPLTDGNETLTLSHRRLETSNFKKLTCNNDMQPCESWTRIYGTAANKTRRIVIPCGTCIRLDFPQDTLTLQDGMDIRGKLVIPAGYRIRIVTPMIVVQGSLVVHSMKRIRGNPYVRFVLEGDQENFFTPIAENRNACGGGPCDVGPRSITVAGGRVSFRGLNMRAPSITRLYDVDSSNSIILPDPDNVLYHWSVGAEIVIATSSQFYDFHQVRTITRVQRQFQPGYIRFELHEDIYKETTLRESPIFATEVSLLSRNIVFESPRGSGGGHFWVMNTPFINQDVRGVEIINFGQASKLGRYPIHFHMCGNSKGSVVARNTIRQSNQRGIVVHGTNNLLIEENVSYDVDGHTYVLEDGIETGNQFIRNIAMQTNNQRFIIPPIGSANNGEETDDRAAAFWITNADNVFLENVVAGAQSFGFWFELLKRGTKVDDYPDLNPKEVPLAGFDGNVVHSVPATAMKFYLNGYEPKTLQIINGLKIYRCNFGLHIHRVHSVEFRGAVIADNSHAISIDLSADIRFTSSNIIGYSQAYQNYVERQFFGSPPCGANGDNRNHALRLTRDGSFYPLQGLFLRNVEFSRYKELPCREKAVIKLVDLPSGYQTFDMMSEYRQVSLDMDLIDLCPGASRGYTDVYLSDIMGSFGNSVSTGVPSTVFINSGEMHKFVNQQKCTTHADKCYTHCRDTCFRTVFYTIPGSDGGKWRLKVCDRDNLDDCFFYLEHLLRGNRKLPHRFAVHVPSGKKYDAVFIDIKTGAEVYPDDVTVEFQKKLCPTAPDDEDIHLLDLPRGHTYSPTSAPTSFAFRCENTVQNSDMELGTRSWSVVGLGGMATTTGYRSNTALNYLGANRGQANIARIQTTLKIGECFQPGTRWEFKARLKMTNSTTGSPVTCDPRKLTGIGCPKLQLTLRDFNHQVYYHRLRGFRPSDELVPGQFNLFQGYWTAGSESLPGFVGRARIARAGFLDFERGVDLAIDDFEVNQLFDSRNLASEDSMMVADDFSSTTSVLVSSDSCYDEIDTSDPSHGHEGAWFVTGQGAIMSVSGLPGSGIGYNGTERTFSWEGPSYDLGALAADDCFGQGSTWSITANLRLVDSTTGEGVACSTSSGSGGHSCPRAVLQIGDMLMNVNKKKLDGVSDWNEYGFSPFQAYFTVPTENEDWTNIATRGSLTFVDFPIGCNLIVDSIAFKRVDGEDAA